MAKQQLYQEFKRETTLNLVIAAVFGQLREQEVDVWVPFWDSFFGESGPQLLAVKPAVCERRARRVDFFIWPARDLYIAG